MGSGFRDLARTSGAIRRRSIEERSDGRFRTATSRVTEAGIIEALGAGWLGKALVGGIAAAAAWFMRRPAEKAAMMAAVDARMKLFLDESDKARALAVEQAAKALARCDAVEKMHIAERAKCDHELAEMRAEIASLMAGPVAGYVTLMRAQPKEG